MNDKRNRLAGSERSGETAVSLATLLPGLAIITVVDLLAFTGRWRAGGAAGYLLPGFLLVIPWLVLAWLRRPASTYGYRSSHLLLDLGWGVVGGSIWRLASLLFNYALLGWEAGAGVLSVASALLWVPFLEETFFRGYLGKNLAPYVGQRGANLMQSLLFTLQPAHLAQGWTALASIFAFGLLAGWLTARRNSLWPALGAHAAANVIALTLKLFA